MTRTQAPPIPAAAGMLRGATRRCPRSRGKGGAELDMPGQIFSPPRSGHIDHETQPAFAQGLIRKEHGFRVDRVAVKPVRRCIGTHDRDAVAVVEEPAEPGDVAIPTTKGWVHKHQARPGLGEPSSLRVKRCRAGTQCSGPGEHGSRSKVSRSASKISGGVYQSSDCPIEGSCSAIVQPRTRNQTGLQKVQAAAESCISGL
jgi:hypothetical protein